MGDKAVVGVIGLGTMGGPMARNLVAAGFTVVAFDVVTERAAAIAAALAAESPPNRPPAQGLAEAGTGSAAGAGRPRGSLAVVANPGDVAHAAEVIVLSLPGSDEVDAVLFGPSGIVNQARPGLIIVDTSTSYPPQVVAAAARLAALGVGLIDAPVSGGRAGAEAATLSIMCGGPTAVLDAVRPVLEALGQRITHLGEAPGSGSYAKLVNQIFVSIHFAAVAEGLTFAAKAGLDLERLLPALQAGWANSTVLGVKAPQILARAFDKPIGTVAVQRKDLDYITRSMADLGIELPFSPQLLAMYDELMARGDAALDQIALVHLFEQRAGLTIGTTPPTPT
ncbi:MAG: NAD(P)-dependent oxidoreductase [Acidimicrobiales bacterium]